MWRARESPSKKRQRISARPWSSFSKRLILPRSRHAPAESSTSQRWRSALGRLRVFSGAEVCTLLVAHGFREVRRRGSHVVMQKRTPESTITVPVPDHKELRIGTLQSIIRQSQLPRTLFEAES